MTDRLTPDRAEQADVLLGQAYFLRFDPKQWEAQQPYAPLGALYAAAAVRAHHYTVALFDSMLAASEAEWASALDCRRPRFAIVYEDSFNYLSKMCLLRMRQAALVMIDAARARGIPTIVAGSDAADHPEVYLDRGAEAVILGEGEITLVEVLDALSGRGSRVLADVRGVAFSRAGVVHRTKDRDVVRDLDALPSPAWDLVDVERYRAIWQRAHGYFSMNLVTTRGCPYHCNWCAKPIYGQRYNVRSPENVVEEMRWLKERYRPDHLWMADDIFGLKPGWIEQFGSLVRDAGASVPFKCLLRADQVTSATAGALEAAGCRMAWVGAESGSQRILDAMEKGIRVDQIVTAARRLHEKGIAVGFFLQFGYPGETWEDIERTRQMVRDSRPDDLGISVSYPLPGTPFYERVRTELGAKRNWFDSDDLAMMYAATYEPDFYRALHAVVHAEFRVRKLSSEVARALAHPSTLRRRHAREAVGAALYGLRTPLLEWRLRRFGRHSPAALPALLSPVLSPGDAAVPSDQLSLR